MYTTLYAPHRIDSLDHLNDVIDAMRKLGAPTIRVVDCHDHYVAIEGSHRLTAAKCLGLQVELDVLEQGDRVAVETLDIQALDLESDDDGTVGAGELAGWITYTGSPVWRLDDQGIWCDESTSAASGEVAHA